MSFCFAISTIYCSEDELHQRSYKTWFSVRFLMVFRTWDCREIKNRNRNLQAQLPGHIVKLKRLLRAHFTVGLSTKEIQKGVKNVSAWQPNNFCRKVYSWRVSQIASPTICPLAISTAQELSKAPSAFCVLQQ